MQQQSGCREPAEGWRKPTHYVGTASNPSLFNVADDFTTLHTLAPVYKSATLSTFLWPDHDGVIIIIVIIHRKIFAVLSSTAQRCMREFTRILYVKVGQRQVATNSNGQPKRGENGNWANRKFHSYGCSDVDSRSWRSSESPPTRHPIPPCSCRSVWSAATSGAEENVLSDVAVAIQCVFDARSKWCHRHE